jgi:hypothetical protein
MSIEQAIEMGTTQHAPGAEPYIQWNHIDGPLLCCRDGTLHWLTKAEQLWISTRPDASAKAGGWADMENSAWWYAEWLKLARRALKQDGFACVFGNWRSLPTMLYAFSKIKWQVDSLMIWDKEWIGPAGPRQLRPTYEVVLFAGMPDAKIENRKRKRYLPLPMDGGKLQDNRARSRKAGGRDAAPDTADHERRRHGS